VAEGTVQVAPDSTGKIIRTQEVTEGANTVEQQVVTIANSDGTLVDATTTTVSNFPASQAVTNAGLTNLDVALSTRLKAADTLAGVTTVGAVTSITDPVAVTGTFYQATQPVSGTVAVSNLPVTQPVSGTVGVNNFPATQPVSGTFFQATQPVSGTVTADLAAGTNVIGHVIADSGSTTAVTALPAIPAGTNLIGHVDVDVITPPTLTKGTQGSTGFSVQDLKDSGRTFITFTVDQATGTTAKVLSTMSINRGGTVTSSTNYTVASGKTLRIQNFSLSFQATVTTMNSSRAYLVATSSGSVATTSPIADSLSASPTAALVNSVGQVEVGVPDGLEIPAGWDLGLAHLEAIATGKISISLNAYEY